MYREASSFRIRPSRSTTFRGSHNPDRGNPLLPFAREEPADRPAIRILTGRTISAAVDGDAVMGGEVVEGCKGDDVVGPWMQPSRDA